MSKYLAALLGSLALALTACGTSPVAKGSVRINAYPENGGYNGFGPSLWLVRSDGLRIPVNVPDDSTATVSVPPGHYGVTHRGKWLTIAPGETAQTHLSCSAKTSVVVRSGSTTTASVGCTSY